MDPTRTFGRDLDLGGRDNLVIPSCGLLNSEWEAKDAPKGNARLFRIVQEYREEEHPLLWRLQDPQDPRLPGLPVCVHPTDEPFDWIDSMLTDRDVEYGCLASLEAEFAKDRERWADNWARDTVREKLTALNLTDEVPGKWDVLFGRGMRIHKRPGNARFHRILQPLRIRYKKAPRDQKAVIVQQAIRIITSSWMIPGGNSATRVRFLKRAPINGHENTMQGQQEGTGSWILASENEVFEKVRHVLRDPKPVKLTTRKNLPTGHLRVLPQEEEQLMNAAGAPIHSRFGRNMPGVYVLVPVSSEEVSNSEPPMPDLEDESLRLTEEELHFLDDIYDPELDGSDHNFAPPCRF